MTSLTCIGPKGSSPSASIASRSGGRPCPCPQRSRQLGAARDVELAVGAGQVHLNDEGAQRHERSRELDAHGRGAQQPDRLTEGLHRLATLLQQGTRRKRLTEIRRPPPRPRVTESALDQGLCGIAFRTRGAQPSRGAHRRDPHDGVEPNSGSAR